MNCVKLILLMMASTLGSADLFAPQPPDEANFLDDEVEPNGEIDFNQGELQSDGSVCITKTKFVDSMEKQQVKECWTQNVSQCHDTYVTEFRPNQERVCEENFWKACKITFKETAFNYTLKTCMKPLVRKCEEPSNNQGSFGSANKEPKIVCKTWFESVCNTTYFVNEEDGPRAEPRPNTWCQKVPKKICAPDFCEMVQGDEICHDKTLQSTLVRPEEVCDLQPSTQCKLVTNLVPHLESKTVCKDIPKEVCHLKLDNPKFVKKPVVLRWCKRPEDTQPTYQAIPATSYSAKDALGSPIVTAASNPTPSYVQPDSGSSSPIYYKPLNFQRN